MERAASGGPASRQAVTRVNVVQASKKVMREPTLRTHGEGRRRRIWGATRSQRRSRRGKGGGMSAQENVATRETSGRGCVSQPDAREGQAGRPEESERPIVPLNLGNARGGKGPWFKANVQAATAGRLT